MPHILPPSKLRAFPNAYKVKPKGTRARWKDDDGCIYEWDYQHGRVEKYTKGGHHVGEFDPETGEQTGASVKGREVEL